MALSKIFFVILFVSTILLTAQTDTLKSKEYLLGVDALSGKDTSKAIDFFKESVKHNKDAPSYFKIAEIRSVNKTQTSLTIAVQYLEKAIQFDPRNIPFRLLDARIREALFYLSKINLEERSAAIKQYRNILDIDSTNFEANYNLGRLQQEDFLQFNRSQIKEEGVKKLSSLEKENLQRMATGTNTASVLAKNMENEFLEKENIFLSLKLDAITNEMFNESEQCLLRTIKSNPNLIKSYDLLTQLYLDNDAPSKAVDILINLRKTIPSYTNAYMYLGLAYHLLREDEKASQEFNRALLFMSKEEAEDFKFNTAKLLLEPKFGNTLDKMSEFQTKNFISNFWQVNDPLILTSYNERLIEHYSRVAYANLFFGVPNENIPGW